jgi:DNA-binding SARP family transcriptional activator
LEEDLRLDFLELQYVDIEIIRQCAEAGRKESELNKLLEVFKTIRT